MPPRGRLTMARTDVRPGCETAAPAGAAAVLESVSVARQPILDRKGHIHGYELLYRCSANESWGEVGAARMTARVIVSACLDIGLERLVGPHRAFVNFDRELLLDENAMVLPPAATVIEILETVRPDEEVLAACRRLKSHGYTLALDDVVAIEGLEPFLPLVDIIKVDVLEAGEAAARAMAARLRLRGKTLLAEKVETREDVAAATKAGYTYFQGYFFTKPVVLHAKRISQAELGHLQVLREVTQPNLDLARLEDALKRDVSLLHGLLQHVNSARFGLRSTIRSVRHAISIIGEDELRRWAALVAIAGMAAGKPPALVVSAIARGRFCELVSEHTRVAGRRSEMFLLGLFSLLDAVLDEPIGSVLNSAPLAADIRQALLGEAVDTPDLAEILGLARGLERADWDSVETLRQRIGLPHGLLASAYIDAVHWADQAAPAQSQP